jgi:hypothetical protein
LTRKNFDILINIKYYFKKLADMCNAHAFGVIHEGACSDYTVAFRDMFDLS